MARSIADVTPETYIERFRRLIAGREMSPQNITTAERFAQREMLDDMHLMLRELVDQSRQQKWDDTDLHRCLTELEGRSTTMDVTVGGRVRVTVDGQVVAEFASDGKRIEHDE